MDRSINNKSELDDVILKVCKKMVHQNYVSVYMEISNWYDTLTAYPISEKQVYEFFWADYPC